MSNRHPSRIGIAQRTDSKGRTQYRGTAYDKRAQRHLRGPWTPHLAEARAWRVDALARLQAGTLSAARGPTVREAVGRFLDGIESGAICRSDGQPYKPSTVRGYRSDLRKRVVPAFGPTRLARLTRTDCQRWVDRLMAEGYAAPTVRNIVAALRALIAWALPRGYTHNDPCSRLRLPSGGKKRERVATPAEAASLVFALPPRDQAAFGLAVYAGLRIGEVVALDVAAIDFNRQVLKVVRGWDATARQFIATKSRKRRTVPISSRLAVLLADHLVLLDHPAEGLLFASPRDPRYPIHPRQLRRHAAKAWRDAGLDPLGFHEARHTFASTAIAAGMNAKTLCTLMGHASITVTYDTYGHLLRGNESEARDLLDTYLDDSGG
jgi:integrase